MTAIIRGDCKSVMDWVNWKAREGGKYREAVKGLRTHV